MPLVNTPIREGVTGARTKWAVGKYDFAVDGGAVGTIALMGATAIPSGATILRGFIDVTTTVTSGGALTYGIQVEAAGDIVAAGTALSTLAAGRHNVLPALASASGTANTAIVRTTAARDISFVIAAQAATAGVFYVCLEYMDALA